MKEITCPQSEKPVHAGLEPRLPGLCRLRQAVRSVSQERAAKAALSDRGIRLDPMTSRLRF